MHYLLALTPFTFLLPLPIHLTTLVIFLATTLMGYLQKERNPKAMLFLAIAIILSVMCVGLPFPRTLAPFTPLDVIAFMAWSAMFGLYLRTPSPKTSLAEIIIWSALTFFAVVLFSRLGNEDWGIMGRIVLYGIVGFIGGQTNRLRNLAILSLPVLILGIFFFDPTLDPYPKVLLLSLPIAALAAVFLGAFLANHAILWKAIGMGSLILIASVFAFLWFPKFIYQTSWSTTNTPLIPFNLTSIDNTTLQNKDLKGKVTWLDLYASYCNPCVTQMEYVTKVQKTFANDPRVQFISVASSEFDSWEKFTRAKRFKNFPLWHGYEHDGKLAQTYAKNGVPVGILIDQKGTVRNIKRGFFKRDHRYFQTDLQSQILRLFH